MIRSLHMPEETNCVQFIMNVFYIREKKKQKEEKTWRWNRAGVTESGIE